MMKTAYYTNRGAARDVLKLGDMPRPMPQAGEVLVRLHASGVNPSDWKSRSGLSTSTPPPVPVIPHSDGAGVIAAVGEHVDPARVGERVWVWNGQWQRPHGTAAEYIALPQAQAVLLPGDTSFAAGACLGIPALTALQALRLSGAAAGDTVLVHGGAGSVSHYAIQFARARGVRVLTTVSGAAKAAHALSAGAEVAINYRTEDVGERVREQTAGRGVDAVLDLNYAANALLLPSVIRPHGRVVVYGTNDAESTEPALWMMRNSIGVSYFLIYDISQADRQAVIAQVTDALLAGWLQHTIAASLPLSAIVEAHELVERGQVIGNVVLTMV